MQRDSSTLRRDDVATADDGAAYATQGRGCRGPALIRPTAPRHSGLRLLMLTVLGGLAEFEMELIRARTGEGRARAKAGGQSLGRPRKLTPHQRKGALARKADGEPVREIARSYNVSAATISRL